MQKQSKQTVNNQHTNCL